MAEVVSGEAVVLDLPCAAFPSRILALIIDVLIQAGTLFVLAVVIAAASPHFNLDSFLAVALSASFLVIVGYPTVFETLSRGRSLGKMALGLRVVSDDGGPERFRQALVRGLASIVEIWLLSGAPALICSMLSSRGKRLGDLFAGTFVIQERLPRRPVLPPWLAVVPQPLLAWAQTLELSRLQDQTAEQAASYLRRLGELSPVAREKLGQQIAAAVAAQVTPPPPTGTPPTAFLSAVLAVRRQREMARLAALQAAAAGQPAGSYLPAPHTPVPYPGPHYPPPPQYQAAPQYPATQQYPAAPQYQAAQQYPAPQYPAGQPPVPAPPQYQAAPQYPASQQYPATQQYPAGQPPAPDPATARADNQPSEESPEAEPPVPGGFVPPV